MMNESPKLETTELANFVELIARMSRLLTGIANVPPFDSGRLALSEWVALSIVSERAGMSNSQLAKRIGVTNQRANQITASLLSAGLISTQTSKEDARRNEIRITEAGQAELHSVNLHLAPIIAKTTGGYEKLLPTLVKRINRLINIILLARQPGN